MGARKIAPATSIESDHVEWIPILEIPSLIAQRKIVGATTIAALLYAAAIVLGR